jgi:competence protein ComEC
MMNNEKSQYAFSVIDVGQGSMQVFELGDGDCIIFDCNLKGAREYVLRYLGRRKVKRILLLVITGTDEDHADVDGLRLLAARYERDIERIWIPDFPKDTENWKAFQKVLAELEKDGTIVEKPIAGDEAVVSSVHIKALGPHPDDSDTSNNASLVVKLTVGRVGILVPGDCEDKRWESILRFFKKWLPADILVAPHHGSEHGCVKDVIEIVNPLYTVVSVGEDNTYGHPDKTAMATYQRLTQKEVFTTKDDGSVLFEFDDERITNVIPHAGKDPDGLKDEVKQVAGALAGFTSIYISRSGMPSTTPASGVPYRPTHYHGGDKADDPKEGD